MDEMTTPKDIDRERMEKVLKLAEEISRLKSAIRKFEGCDHSDTDGWKAQQIHDAIRWTGKENIDYFFHHIKERLEMILLDCQVELDNLMGERPERNPIESMGDLTDKDFHNHD